MQYTTDLNQHFAQMVSRQDNLYDEIVFPAMIGDSELSLDEAMSEYNKQVGVVDARSLKKTMDAVFDDVRQSNPDKYNTVVELLPSIAEYSNARNNFQSKVKDLLDSDADRPSIQAAIDSLDWNRTQAHNRCFKLINTLNTIAVNHSIKAPFGNNALGFDTDEPNDRETIAKIVEHIEPVMTLVNHNVKALGLESSRPDFKKMSLRELRDYAEQQRPTQIDFDAKIVDIPTVNFETTQTIETSVENSYEPEF